MNSIRVRWLVGRGWWWADFEGPEADEQSKQKVAYLLARGFQTTSKAGVTTYYPAHRITKITRRVMPA